jgi:DNA-binding CsgD family transcriptional regulator
MNADTDYPISIFAERRASFSHKLKRIKQQEDFRQSHFKKFDRLTRREMEVINLLARDYNNPKIAERLSISRHTVEQHRKNINRKLGINSSFQLFQYALAFNLI